MRKWKKPEIVEIAVGLEINAYASASGAVQKRKVPG